MSNWTEHRGLLGGNKKALYMFPHAGAGARTYLHWAAELANDVALYVAQLPGRENRIHEPYAKSAMEVVERVAEEIASRQHSSLSLFGHSFGALLAFEVTRYLRRIGAPLPEVLILTGGKAPTMRDPASHIHTLPFHQFVDAVIRRYDGFPKEILDDSDALNFFTKVLRADICLLEQYVYTEEPPLPCRIEVLGGRGDLLFPPPLLEPWQEQAAGEFNITWLEGGHFFLFGREKNRVMQLICSALGLERHNVSN